VGGPACLAFRPPMPARSGLAAIEGRGLSMTGAGSQGLYSRTSAEGAPQSWPLPLRTLVGGSRVAAHAYSKAPAAPTPGHLGTFQPRPRAYQRACRAHPHPASIPTASLLIHSRASSAGCKSWSNPDVKDPVSLKQLWVIPIIAGI